MEPAFRFTWWICEKASNLGSPFRWPPESNREPMKGSFFEVARYDCSSKSFLGFELLAEKDWKKPKITSVSSYHLVTIQALSWLFSQIYGRSQTSQSVHRKHLKQFNLLTKCSGNSWAALKDVARSLSFENMNHMELLWSLYLCRILVADLPKISSRSIVSKSATNLRFATSSLSSFARVYPLRSQARGWLLIHRGESV